jgi:hypothetical protein
LGLQTCLRGGVRFSGTVYFTHLQGD